MTATAAKIESRTIRAVPSLREAMNAAGYQPDDDWGSDEYKTTMLALARTYGLTRLLEIGGGRHPLFTLEEARANGFEMTINDISAVELENMKTPGFKTACFNVAGDISAVKKESFDLIYSHMVFEHVADVEHAWRNVYQLLAPGGVAVAYYPALYAVPFIINKLVPESVSSKLVQMLYREREEDDKPKFPAHYDYCYGMASRVEPMLRRVGFCDAAVLPFYGHHYYDKIPVARQIGALATRIAKHTNFTPMAAYAYAIVRK